MQKLPAEQQQQIIDAIKNAELATSGEIRVHIEGVCPNGDPMARAVEVFEHLGMHKTREQNGVLFYVAIDDRKFAVIGDKGIDQKVPAHFWEDIKIRFGNSLRSINMHRDCRSVLRGPASNYRRISPAQPTIPMNSPTIFRTANHP